MFQFKLQYIQVPYHSDAQRPASFNHQSLKHPESFLDFSIGIALTSGKYSGSIMVIMFLTTRLVIYSFFLAALSEL